MNVVILENIRSAYNVGNIIRTADALGWQVRLTGYSPSPVDNKKVVKTSLGAEEAVGLRQFGFTQEAIDEAKKLGFVVMAAEIIDTAISLDTCAIDSPVALVFGNEVDGVLPDTLAAVDNVAYIPMLGIKESLNVGQSAAIMMRHFRH
ncbi:MAG: TrmH family RNA methyltransferase [Candidatus Absconditabacteria bacterium]